MRLLEREETTRIDALSDGLFAIVLTLLVLQFEVPEVAPDEVPAALAAQRPLLLSYLLSFAVVGLYWIIHHNVFLHIVRHDRLLLYCNLLFLPPSRFSPSRRSCSASTAPDSRGYCTRVTSRSSAVR